MLLTIYSVVDARMEAATAATYLRRTGGHLFVFLKCMGRGFRKSFERSTNRFALKQLDYLLSIPIAESGCALVNYHVLNNIAYFYRGTIG